jgi:putative phosphoesterase
VSALDDVERGAKRVTSRIRLGLVSDLHGRFDPLLPKVLDGVERIVLAGDTVDETLIGRLREIAPVDAVRGNNDRSPGLLALPEFLDIEVAGTRLLVAHDRKDRRLGAVLTRSRPDVLVVGHSHRPLLAREGGVLIVNPGSAGPRRFRLPRTAGTLTLSRGRAPRVALWDLDRDAPYRLMLQSA